MTNLVITVGPQNWDAFEKHMRSASPAVDRLARSFEEADAALLQALDLRQTAIEKETMNPLNQTDVANLRESIRATVTHLSGKTVPEAETALQKQLEFLLAQERALFTTGVAAQKTDADKPDTPWYPDDSGKWVEVPSGFGCPKGLDLRTTVEVLLSKERISKTYKYWARPAGSWRWMQDGASTPVAYKIVE